MNRFIVKVIATVIICGISTCVLGDTLQNIDWFMVYMVLSITDDVARSKL